VASFSHTISVPKPPGEVFPWLLEEDKVPQWTTRLQAYEVLGGGAIGHGTRIRQVLTVSGQALNIELEIIRYDPPGFAESRFSTNGLEVETTYALRAAGAGTELTQTLEGKANGFKARLLVPVVQPKLEAKLAEDLERLRELLS
jgi:Polyketide cyclase / dehydrase and lipid transport